MSMRNSREVGSSDRPKLRSLRVVAATALCAAALVASPAFAQKGKAPTEPEKPPKSYTLPYFFSGLAVLMVVVPLCFPSMRKAEAPKDEDD